MKKVEKECAPLGHILVAGAVFVFASMYLRGWAVATLWGWFVCPLGAPPLGLLHAMGLAVLASVLRGAYGSPPDPETKEKFAQTPWTITIARLLMDPTIVGIAWLIRQGM